MNRLILIFSAASCIFVTSACAARLCERGACVSGSSPCWDDVRVVNRDEVNFGSAGCSVERVVSGDLSNDGIPDLVLIVRRDCALAPDQVACDEEKDRGVWVALSEGNKFKPIALSFSVLRCASCYGAMAAGSSGEVKIEKGQLVIDQLWGSRETVNLVHRFHLDDAAESMLLISKEKKVEDRLSGRYTLEVSDLASGETSIVSGHFDQKRRRYVEDSVKLERHASDRVLLQEIED
ncbi:MAG: hypothetical protein V4607_06430 [Pseudomonadota bacterium]